MGPSQFKKGRPSGGRALSPREGAPTDVGVYLAGGKRSEAVGSGNDILLMHRLVRARHVIPEHGEPHMRAAHGELARQIGYPDNQIHLLVNGEILEFEGNGILSLNILSTPPARFHIPVAHLDMEAQAIIKRQFSISYVAQD